jgi:hypothetical protein
MFIRLSVRLAAGEDVDLLVSQRNWLRIARGGALTIRGKGYYRGSIAFYDHWTFQDGIDGILTVRVEQRGGEAAPVLAFTGTPREAFDQSNGWAIAELGSEVA